MRYCHYPTAPSPDRRRVRTWFEWSCVDSQSVKTRVVEVEFETNPNSPEFTQNVLNAIETTAIGVAEEATIVVSQLKVVTKTPR